MQFISQHPDVVAEKETDGLLVMAFNASLWKARMILHGNVYTKVCCFSIAEHWVEDGVRYVL